jgi:hypothetical protein
MSPILGIVASQNYSRLVNRFVAVGMNTVAATSDDGITWTSRTISTNAGTGIIYTDVYFAASSGNTATSPNGVAWTSKTDVTGGNAFRFFFGGNGYGIVLGSGGVVTYTSNNASTWTQSSMPTGTGDWFGGAYDYTNKRYLAVTLNNGSVPSTLAATSTNGSSWTQRTLSASGAWRRAGYGDGRWLVVGLNSSYGNSNTGSTSTNGGTSWSNFTLPTSVDWYGVTYGNGVFVAMANNSTVAASSTNGTTWTQRTLPSTKGWGTPVYGNGIFLAMSGMESSSSNEIASSTDGTTWTARTMPSSNSWMMAAYNSDGGQGQ